MQACVRVYMFVCCTYTYKCAYMCVCVLHMRVKVCMCLFTKSNGSFYLLRVCMYKHFAMHECTIFLILMPCCLHRSEDLGSDVVVVRELVTGWQGILPVSGSGSADERVVDN